MAFRTISVLITGNSGPLRASLISAAREVETFETHVKRSGDAVQRTARLMGTVLVGSGAALTAALAGTVVQAARFETEMRNVNSIVHTSEAELAAMGDQVLDLSRQVPQSATQLAAGLYDIASSGFAGAEGLSVLDASAMAASAGLSSTEVAARGITAVLNAYGKSGFEAAAVSDTLFQTVNVGVVTFEELANTLGDFVAMAAAFGRNAQGDFIIPIEDASAALATMTLAGLSAADAGTSLNRVLQAFVEPSHDMSTALSDLGYESGVAAIEALGLQGAVDALRGATGGSIEELKKLFPEQRAARGAFALMANEGRNYAEVASAITDETARLGATQAAFNEQSKGVAFQLQQARNAGSALAIELGQVLLPVAADVAQVITGVLMTLGHMPAAMRLVITVAAGLTAAATLLGGAFLLLGPRIAAARASLAAMSVTAPRLASGVGLAAKGIGILGVGLTVATLAMASWGGEQAKARQRTEELTDAIRAESSGVDGATDSLIAQRLARLRLVDAARDHGLSLEQLAAAARGDRAALNEFTRAARESGAASEGQLFFLAQLSDEFRRASENAAAHAEAENVLADVSAELEQDLAAVGAATGENADEFDELAASIGLTGAALQRLTDNSIETARTFSGDIQQAMDSASSAFLGFTDVVSSFSASSWERLKTEAGDGVGSITEEVRSFYERVLTEGQAFSDNVRDAIARGLDPQVVTRLLTEGPSEAAPLLEAILSDHSGNMIALVNQSEQLAEEINFQVRESARLTQIAVSRATDQANRDLPLAMQIVQQQATSGIVSISELAGVLGISFDDAKRIVETFGITVRTTAQGPVQEAKEKVDELGASVAALPDANITVTADTSQAEAAIARIIRLQQGLGDDLANTFGATTIRPRAVEADGGVVRFYGRGGTEHHVAQIAPAGAWRVWAEPETGGEAYIPLAPGKRARSMAILQHTASIFGRRVVPYHDGGWVEPLPSRAVGSGIDYDRLARAIADGLAGSGIDYGRLGAAVATALSGVKVEMGEWEVGRVVDRTLDTRRRAYQ